jgi:hypothetical protein
MKAFAFVMLEAGTAYAQTAARPDLSDPRRLHDQEDSARTVTLASFHQSRAVGAVHRI